MISSLDNKTVKQLTRLHQKKYRDDSFLIFDEKLIQEAYKHNYLKMLVYTDKIPFDFDNSLEVSKEVLDKIAKRSDLKYLGVSKLIDNKRNYGNRVIILDHLQDPLNIGRIMESCLLFGFDSVILSDNCADIYNEKCLDNCKGALYSLNINICDISKEISYLQNNGYKVFATGLRNNTKTLHDIEVLDKMAFVLGNEGSGVEDSIMDICDEIIKIDMCNIDSLNVSMAGAIIMYNFSIQL